MPSILSLCDSCLLQAKLICLQCDQVDPACSQCKRAGKTCSGYRDLVALSFRDESAKVVGKVHAPKTATEKRRPSKMKSASEEPTPKSVIPCPEAKDFKTNMGAKALQASWGSNLLAVISRDLTPPESSSMRTP